MRCSLSNIQKVRNRDIYTKGTLDPLLALMTLPAPARKLKTSYWTVGRLMPRVTVVVAALIVLSGLLPLEWFPFADYEIARQVLQPDAPFMPGLNLHKEYFAGSEVLAGNLPQTEFLPLRTFTTDSAGFRGTPKVEPDEPPALVVFRGFSFTWGASLSDQQTFPAALSRQLGVNAYDAARFHDDEEVPEDFDRLVGRLPSRPKLAVYVHLEPNAHVRSWHDDSPLDRAGRAVLGRDTYEWIDRTTSYARHATSTWLHLSPAILMAVNAKKALENDRILTNRYRKNVVTFTLPDGRRMLVTKGDLERDITAPDEATVRERAEYIAWWNQHLANSGTRMLVLLVPEKISIYGPSLGVKFPPDPYLDRLQRELSARGVRTVNGLPLLLSTAASDLAYGNLAYWREDQHWTVLGVERLAAATAEVIRNEYSALLPRTNGKVIADQNTPPR